MDEAVQIIEIDLPESDRDVLFARIQENLRLHNLTGPSTFPVFEVISPEREVSLHTSALTSMGFNLHQAFEAYAQTWVNVTVPEAGLPLLGRLKHAFHELVVYYVNRLAERQMRFNAALLRIVSELVQSEPADMPEETALLRREVAALRERVERLERQKKEDRDEH